jgi:hypothetical protein
MYFQIIQKLKISIDDEKYAIKRKRKKAHTKKRRKRTLITTPLKAS